MAFRWCAVLPKKLVFGLVLHDGSGGRHLPVLSLPGKSTKGKTAASSARTATAEHSTITSSVGCYAEQHAGSAQLPQAGDATHRAVLGAAAAAIHLPVRLCRSSAPTVDEPDTGTLHDER